MLMFIRLCGIKKILQGFCSIINIAAPGTDYGVAEIFNTGRIILLAKCIIMIPGQLIVFD